MTLTVDAVRLPPAVERRAHAVRSFKTKVWEAEGGYEPQRRAVYELPRRSWVITSIPVSTEGITGSDVETVYAMFEAAQGMLYGFQYKPWHEHTVTRAKGLLAYDAALGGYPLRKVYDNGVRQAFRRIYLPDGTQPITVWVDGVATAVTINSSGVVTSVASGHTVEWAGDFLVPVRFDTDDLEDEMSGDDATYMLPTIKLRELLLG